MNRINGQMGKAPEPYLFNEIFARKLRELRLARSPHLSQELLAQRLQVSRATLANYETGRVSVPMWFVCAAAEYFGVPVSELTGRKDE